MDDEPGVSAQARSEAPRKPAAHQGDRAKSSEQGRSQKAGAGAQPGTGGTFANLFANAKDLKKR